MVSTKAVKDLTQPQLLDLKQFQGLLLQIAIHFQTHGVALEVLLEVIMGQDQIPLVMQEHLVLLVQEDSVFQKWKGCLAC